MKKLLLLVTALFVTICLTPIRSGHAAENNSSCLTAILSEMRVLDTIKDRNALPNDEMYLSLKVRLASTGKTPVAFPINAIALRTAKGKRCELVGMGNGLNDFSAFNVYLPFSAPWYPFSMTYQGNDETKLFGIKQNGKNDTPVISLLATDQVMLLGFVIPADTTTFNLSIGPAKALKISTKGIR
jgi:hypothetical protein